MTHADVVRGSVEVEVILDDQQRVSLYLEGVFVGVLRLAISAFNINI